ncbi:hypothetical protein [Thalassospira sp. CH_XMU1448-2]|uniref:hypothetical protein n=1 Tax=Thalassospira sp. CH_XMU1448-2 TaxID=3107773 RepID=UPI003009B751
MGQVSAKDKGPWQESFEKACLSTLKVALPDKAGLCGILFCQAMPKMQLCAICFVWQKSGCLRKKNCIATKKDGNHAVLIRQISQTTGHIAGMVCDGLVWS